MEFVLDHVSEALVVDQTQVDWAIQTFPGDAGVHHLAAEGGVARGMQLLADISQLFHTCEGGATEAHPASGIPSQKSSHLADHLLPGTLAPNRMGVRRVYI